MSQNSQTDSDRRHLERCILTACLLEASAHKPGNVHPKASFADLCFTDFVRSAEVIAPILARTRELGIGRAILQATKQTQDEVGKNTNLGMVLLFAPLAAVSPAQTLREGIGEVLNGLTQQDASLVYRAIRFAHPGGMGEVAEQDLSSEPTNSLRDVMRLAADHDSIAAQYANGFSLILDDGLEFLKSVKQFSQQWEHAVIHLQLTLMSRAPDTLIARKCGRETAQNSAQKAQAVLDAGWPTTQMGRAKLEELDRWLRSDGHRRNPGTTADLVAASLFAALREGWLEFVIPNTAGRQIAT